MKKKEKDKLRLEVSAQPVADLINDTFGRSFSLRERIGTPRPECPLGCGFFPSGNIPERGAWVVRLRLKTPRETYLICIFITADPVSGCKITPVFGPLDGVIVIEGEMDFTLEGDQLIIYLLWDANLLPAHSTSYTIMMGYDI